MHLLFGTRIRELMGRIQRPGIAVPSEERVHLQLSPENLYLKSTTKHTSYFNNIRYMVQCRQM